MRKLGKEAKSNLIFIGIILIVWLTGWYRPIMSTLQRGIIATGIMQPKTNDNFDGGIAEAFLLDENDKPMMLSDLRGKVIFLNVWATWCPPCKAEMPGIQDLYDAVKSQDIAFVMLSTDQNFDKAKTYKKENSFTFPIYQLRQDLPPELESSAIPATFVIDKTGRIKMKHAGMAKYNSDKFKNFLKELNKA